MKDVRLIIAFMIIIVWATSFLADIVIETYSPRYEITTVAMVVVVWLFKPTKEKKDG